MILRRPVHHVETKPTVSERRDDQPAGCGWGIGLVMARSAQRHQAVAIEVRAAARALDDVVDVQAAAAAAQLFFPVCATKLLNCGTTLVPWHCGHFTSPFARSEKVMITSKALLHFSHMNS